MSGYTGDAKYVGPEKIVVAMDVGTTQSAVSFSYLYPDDNVRVRMVNKWPGQPESVGSSKIPTLVAYRHGQYKACGSEALEYVDDDQYDIAKWFKLHLHPSSMKTSDTPPPYGSINDSSDFEIPTLPTWVTVDQVYADFMRYLMENTRISFEQAIPNGAAVWRRLRDTLVIILTTPNGWDFTQQSMLRRAAIAAGLVTAENQHRLLDFVTEGEASVHYALAYSQSKTWMAVDSVFAVVDVGGSTVDSTLYECESTNPKVTLTEICPSECIQAGGIFVDREAEKLFKQKLRGSKYGDPECIAEMVAAFETRTKRLYDGGLTSSVVDFGSSRDNDRPRGIIKGKLSLTSEEVGATFDGVIKQIMDSCSGLLSNRDVKYLLLVGGFGESPYLQKRLEELFNTLGVTVVAAEEPSKKAAAEGAMLWFVKQYVTARVAKATFGVKYGIRYDSNNREHVKRARHVSTDLSGEILIPQGFCALLTKGTQMHSDFTMVRPFVQLYQSLDEYWGSFSDDIEVWDGQGIPSWATDIDGTPLPQMRTLCTLVADLSGLRASLRPLNGPRGRYYEVKFKIVIRFGGTQLQAQIQWEEDGQTREGPVSIIPSAAF